MILPLSSKLPNVSTTIFTKMSQMAIREGAINLSQGFPDFEIDQRLIELTKSAYEKNKHQYAPMSGSEILKEVISSKVSQLHHKFYNPETEVTITAGATQAIFTIIAALIKPGDEVILFKPAYDCYEPSIKLFKGTIVPVQLKYPDYKPDWNEFASKITSKTKLVIINSPHNPSGSVWSHNDMIQLEKHTKNSNAIILSDEVYEHITFDGNKHHSVAKYPVLAERSFIVASFGKTFHITGWKIGYCLAPKNLMEEFRKIHQFNVFSVHHPIQEALAVYLSEAENYLNLSNFYQEKRDLFLTSLKNSRFHFKPASGTYFQLLHYENITDENDVEFAKRLTKEFKIAAIPVSVFNEHHLDEKVLRFCFAKKEETLEKAAEILCRV